jgi:hypothetical protein
VGGFCWAGSIAQSYAFHADEFDHKSQKRFDERLFTLQDLGEHPNEYLTKIEKARNWMITMSNSAKDYVFFHEKIDSELQFSQLPRKRQIKILSAIDKEYKKRLSNQTNQQMVEDYKKLLELRPFIEMLVLSQHHKYYPDFFPTGESPGQDNLEIVKAIVTPKILMDHGGLQIIRRKH